MISPYPHLLWKMLQKILSLIICHKLRCFSFHSSPKKCSSISMKVMLLPTNELQLLHWTTLLSWILLKQYRECRKFFFWGMCEVYCTKKLFLSEDWLIMYLQSCMMPVARGLSQSWMPQRGSMFPESFQQCWVNKELWQRILFQLTITMYGNVYQATVYLYIQQLYIKQL